MMMVCDASAAVEVVVSGERADEIRTEWRSADHIVAPDLYVNEVANALWKYARAGVMTDGEAMKGLDFATAIVDKFIRGEEYVREALSVAISRRHPVYDATYLVLARRFACPLVTMDVRLATHARELGLQVIPREA